MYHYLCLCNKDFLKTCLLRVFINSLYLSVLSIIQEKNLPFLGEDRFDALKGVQVMRAQLSNGVWIQSKFQLGQLQEQELKDSKRLSMG